MAFEPIAIIGQGCVFPGAADPGALWTAIAEGRDLTTEVPEGAWPVGLDEITGPYGRTVRDANGAPPRRGGFVTGFEPAFDPDGFLMPAEKVIALDRSVQWLFDSARQAVRDAGYENAMPSKTAIVIGNHSYPTSSLVDLAFTCLVEVPLGVAEMPANTTASEKWSWANRFSSGRPAHLLAQALGADGPAFCLDAACASSIYAIKLGCDYLQDGTVDLALSGAVCGTDNIFLHLGFADISALSPRGISAPFSRHADGLLPAEGAGTIVLKRLADAVRDGNSIHGVIRGIGLSNDGRQGGLLAPSGEGQVRAIKNAYSDSGLNPATISLLECHATGTPVGDGTELESIATVFSGTRDLPVGSIKSNMGHALTAAGIGAVLKVTGALAAGIRPPTLHAREPLARFDTGPFRPLQGSEPWTDVDRRRAGINNFGFGGTNAHLILEEYAGDRRVYAARTPVPEAIAICGIGAIAGKSSGFDAFCRELHRKDADATGRMETVQIPFAKLRFQPNDLKQSLGQQTAILAAAQQAMEDVAAVDPERGGVIVGIGCDVDAARCCLEIRVEKAAAAAGVPRCSIDADKLTEAMAALTSPGHVIGAMPNLPANRINAQFDWRGLGYTVSSEEISGLTALEIAIRALRQGELDLALAGAVDLSHETVNRLAGEAVFAEERHQPGDAAIAFVLKRLRDAEVAGDRVLATIDVTPARRREQPAADMPAPPDCAFGHAHAAAGMVRITEALATEACQAENRTDGKHSAPSSAHALSMGTFTGMDQTATLDDIAPRAAPGIRPDAPFLFYTAAEDPQGLKDALIRREFSRDGTLRIAITATDRRRLDDKIARVTEMIEAHRSVAGPGVHFRQRPLDGAVAFVYPGSAAAYAGAGSDLVQMFPEVRHDFLRCYGEDIDTLLNAAVESPESATQYADRAAATTTMAILGTRILREHLDVAPSATIGLSIGEANMLAATGVWQDPKSVLNDLVATGFYDEVGSSHRAIASLWNRPDTIHATWENHEIFAAVEDVEEVVRGIPRVWLLIVTSPKHCMIGGAPEACTAAIDKLRPQRSVRSREDLSFHGPFASAVGDAFHRVHTRTVSPAPGVRFYFNARHDRVEPEAGAIADCLRDQGMNRVDLRPTVLKAWQDGIRTFVDIGPGNGLGAAISATLENQPHVVASLDHQRRDGLHQLADLAGTLFAAGVPIDIEGLAARLDRLRGEPAFAADAKEPRLLVPAHLPPVDTAIFEDLRRATSDIHRKHCAAEIGTMRATAAQRPDPVRETTPHRNMQNLAAVPGGPAASSAAMAASVENGDPAGVEEILPGTDIPGTGENDAMTFQQKANPAKNPGKTGFKPIEIRAPTGPTFDRTQLETLAGGKISSVFGPLFKQQDGFKRQCRMPQPPLLLADRVLGIEGEAGSMGTGICWTETDIAQDAWYLHHGSMPTGLLIEAGQADLLLISWLGADFLNQDERVYRLLGCEITFHDGEPPMAGDTIRYQIHVDGHAKLGETRLFFFRYDARIGDRLISSVRNGQAGFFSDTELANARGILWSAEEDAPASGRCDPAPGCSTKRQFSKDEVTAFAEGNAFVCFGTGFERAAAHTRTPSIPSGKMRLIDRVDMFDPEGGPWGRGYLKASVEVPVDAWYYDGHFKNDPCMPGTLMAEAAVQSLIFYMAALGITIDRDGWTFRPVTGEACKFICRGQVIPDKPHKITYEVFIEEIADGDTPTAYAALLARCDGSKVFLCRRFGIKLVRDWPLAARTSLAGEAAIPRIVSPVGDVPGDERAVLACAWGRQSDAFGSMYDAFDGPVGVPRLPGPPYLCISRIISVDCPPATATPGGRAECEFDINPNAWFFADSGNGFMPFSVLCEVLLQPCGWLASYMGFALAGNLKLRNLDAAQVKIHREIGPDAGKLCVQATFEKSSTAGPMSIVFYDIVCRCGEEVVATLKTDFGLFPAQALANQKGLPATEAMRSAVSAPSSVEPISLTGPAATTDLTAGLPVRRLTMVDRITGFWPEGGCAELGRSTGHQTIDPSAWYFKAHFYEDPVQPGSAGLEALFTLFKATVKLKGLHNRFANPRMEAPALGTDFWWKYRGQVVPTNRQVFTEIDITSIDEEDDAILVTAQGSLWADDLRIYEVGGYALRIREAGSDAPAPKKSVANDSPAFATGAPAETVPSVGVAVTRRSRAVDLEGWTIDASADPWLNDHCPTYNIPVFPMMALVADLLAGSTHIGTTALRDVELHRWLHLDEGTIRLTSKVFALPDGRISRQIYRQADSKAQRIGRATVVEEDGYPAAPEIWSDLPDNGVSLDPYISGELFHFDSFRVATDFLRSGSVSRFCFDAGEAIRRAKGHFGILMDALLHGIPHSRPALWFSGTRHMAAFPSRIERLQLYAALPDEGELTVISRPAGRPSDRTIRAQVQVVRSNMVIMELDLVEALVPIGAYESLEPGSRRSFACDHEYHPGWAIAEVGSRETTLQTTVVKQANWLPGTLEAVYCLTRARNQAAEDLVKAIAVKDHFAVRHRVHPAMVQIGDGHVRIAAGEPVMPFEVTWLDDETVQIRDAASNIRRG